MRYKIGDKVIINSMIYGRFTGKIIRRDEIHGWEIKGDFEIGRNGEFWYRHENFIHPNTKLARILLLKGENK